VRFAVVTTSYPLRDGQAAGHFVAAEVQRMCVEHEVLVIAPGTHTEALDGAPRVLRSAGRGLFGPPGALTRAREQPLRAWGGLEFCARARLWLKREGPFDRVIAHWLFPCAWPIAAGLRCPVEAVAHGSDVRLLARAPALLRRHITRVWLDGGVSIRTVSNELRELLLDCTSWSLGPQVRVEPMQLQIDPQLERTAARRRLGVARNARLVLLVARLIPEKRVAVALRAVSRLPEVQVVVVGGGPLLAELERRFGSVVFTGELPRPEALDWIAAADVVISASQLEGAPTALREARALGVPVVACGAGDLAERAARDGGIWLL
jgi:glycosyltransferase involved in cell wall biosynthesis